MIAGGTFTEVRNQGSNTAIALSRLMSFNATTGQINTAFAPNPNGVVNVVRPTGDGTMILRDHRKLRGMAKSAPTVVATRAMSKVTIDSRMTVLRVSLNWMPPATSS